MRQLLQRLFRGDEVYNKPLLFGTKVLVHENEEEDKAAGHKTLNDLKREGIQVSALFDKSKLVKLDFLKTRLEQTHIIEQQLEDRLTA